ncbi:MAG TPA: alpha/beta hydrolase [Sphingomonas sp.]|jgi:pimeloyl-ACP methyl ester carboxylesterase
MIHALLLAHAAIATPALAQTTPAASAASAIVQMDHISIETVGKGDPVVLIPGLSIGREGWRDTATRLARTHRVLMVQVNGFGGSAAGANVRPGLLDGIVADLHRAIATEKTPPAVIGHSMGGLVGMMLAARHPDQVGRLMVVDALPFIGTIMAAPGATPKSIAPQAAMMRDRVAASPPAPVATADPGGIWSNTAAGRITVANWSRTADPRVVAQALYEDMTTDVTPLLPSIAARPFTVVYAAGAGPTVEPIWTRAYAGSPATLQPVPGSYHFIMLDQPAAFAAAVDAFLAR